MDHWKSPEHHGSSFKNYRSSGRNRRDSDRKDNWGGFSRNENADRSRRGTDDSYEKRNSDRKDSWSGYPRNETVDHYRSDHASDQRKLRGSYRFKQNDNNQHGASRPQISPKRTRGVGYRNSDPHRKPQNSYSDDKFRRNDYNRSNSRKKYSYRAHSRSTSRSGSDHVENQFTIRAYNLWQNDKISEDQTKQNRVEKWVKSVNKTNMWGNKELSPNPKIFAYDTKAKFAGKVPSDQKDKSSRSYTKFDRYEANRNKSSEEEYEADLGIGNKSCENSNYASQRDYNETKNLRKGTAYNVGSAKQMGGIKMKGVQSKRSPQYSSGSSTKNESFRKQRRFDGKGPKDDDRNRYKSKMQDNATNDSWKNSTLDSTRNKTSSVSKLENADPWNQEDDGVWGNTDQSHIKWKISDEETDEQETKNRNKKEAEKNSDLRDNWNDNQVASDSKRSTSKIQSEEKHKGQVPPDNDDGIGSNVEQNDIRWKNETQTISQDAQDQSWEVVYANATVESNNQAESKKDTGYEIECKEIDQSNIKNSSERNEELITSDQKAYDSGSNEGNISEHHSNSCTRQQNSDVQEAHIDEDTIVNSFKRSVCISDEKSISISINYSDKPVASDDGGWSTVSEEGEVHSDDANKKL